MQEKTEQEPVVENVEQLKKWYVLFSRRLHAAADRRDRYKDLLGRKFAKKHSQDKIAKMARRFTSAMNEVEQSEGALDQIKFRLEQISSTDR